VWVRVIALSDGKAAVGSGELLPNNSGSGCCGAAGWSGVQLRDKRARIADLHIPMRLAVVA